MLLPLFLVLLCLCPPPGAALWFPPEVDSMDAVEHELVRTGAKKAFILHWGQGNTQWEASLRLWFNEIADRVPALGVAVFVMPGAYTTSLSLHELPGPAETKRYEPAYPGKERISNHRALYKHFFPPEEHKPLVHHLLHHHHAGETKKEWIVAVMPFDADLQHNILKFRQYAERGEPYPPRSGRSYLYTEMRIDMQHTGPFLARIAHIEPHLGWNSRLAYYRISFGASSGEEPYLIQDLPVPR